MAISILRRSVSSVDEPDVGLIPSITTVVKYKRLPLSFSLPPHSAFLPRRQPYFINYNNSTWPAKVDNSSNMVFLDCIDVKDKFLPFFLVYKVSNPLC